MRNIYTTYLLTLLTLILSACTSDDASVKTENITPPFDTTWEEPSPEEQEELKGSYATIKGFEPGDAVTRSSWTYNGQKLVFGWQRGDAIGIYSTAGIAKSLEQGQAWNQINPDFLNPETESNKHPQYTVANNLCRTDPTRIQSTRFVATNPNPNSQIVQLFGGDGDFEWDTETRWSAYFPFNDNFSPYNGKRFNALPFDFRNQIQMGIPDMTAFYNGTTGNPAGESNPDYINSEIKACEHLGQSDVLIAPEMQWNNERINFQLRHIGAVARFFLLAPDEELNLVSLELICDKKIFYESGTMDLSSHVYNSSKTNKGAKLVGDESDGSLGNIQMTHSGEPTQKLTLNFPTTYAVKIKPTSVSQYGNYFIAYLLMYPIKYDSENDGNLYAYVTATNTEGKEVHFVSEALSSKTMKSGYYYQWTARTHEADGLYPIELTATLLPWQDIVGGNISTDLTK